MTRNEQKTTCEMSVNNKLSNNKRIFRSRGLQSAVAELSFAENTSWCKTNETVCSEVKH